MEGDLWLSRDGRAGAAAALRGRRRERGGGSAALRAPAALSAPNAPGGARRAHPALSLAGQLRLSPCAARGCSINAISCVQRSFKGYVGRCVQGENKSLFLLQAAGFESSGNF